jgi:hypothetical protein
MDEFYTDYGYPGEITLGGYNPDDCYMNQHYQESIVWVPSALNSTQPDSWYVGL